ncbi:hypothetical protein ACFLZ2_05230 [Candidatus Margulisiibacteriota bacterium]
MDNIYLLYGEEDFMLKEEINALKKKYLDPADPFGLEYVEGASVSTDQLINVIINFFVVKFGSP